MPAPSNNRVQRSILLKVCTRNRKRTNILKMADTQLIDVSYDGKKVSIEYQMLRPEATDRPLLVFIHEGLGSVGMWKQWPAHTCDTLDCRGLVFSRYGYGKSTARPHNERWAVDFLHIQAQQFMPAFFEALGLDTRKDRPVLVGHSDGASIALLYAAAFPDRIRAAAVLAPHLFVEDVTIRNIENAKAAFSSTDLPQKLARYHADVDSALWGWNDAWLNPAFRDWNIEEEVARIQCPVLALQGRDDEYGTLAQVEHLAELARNASLYIMDDCRHSPHIDKPQETTDAIAAFVRKLS